LEVKREKAGREEKSEKADREAGNEKADRVDRRIKREDEGGHSRPHPVR